MADRRPVMVDLFAGIGGFSLAGEWVGFRTAMFCERDPYCRRVLAKHWPEVPIHGDIHTLTGEIVRDHLEFDYRAAAVSDTAGARCEEGRNDGLTRLGMVNLVVAGFAKRDAVRHVGTQCGMRRPFLDVMRLKIAVPSDKTAVLAGVGITSKDAPPPLLPFGVVPFAVGALLRDAVFPIWIVGTLHPFSAARIRAFVASHHRISARLATETPVASRRLRRAQERDRAAVLAGACHFRLPVRLCRLLLILSRCRAVAFGVHVPIVPLVVLANNPRRRS